jgi:uncharacterized small protein (DUF1192 family)
MKTPSSAELDKLIEMAEALLKQSETSLAVSVAEAQSGINHLREKIDKYKAMRAAKKAPVIQ